MLYQQFKPQEIEPEILKFWQENKIIQKARDKNKKKEKYYFLDGPPYTSGKFHLGHAWNYALKDIVLRYKRMRGYDVWDRNGFDVHGLPTEHKVMEKFNLHTKEDIIKFGVDKFVKECEKFCLEMAGIMTIDLIRMGVTFDVSNPYMALKTEFMEGEWALIKKAYEKKRLYYGEKVLTWCQHCETAVAKHECEYKNVTDNSIFVKFPIKDKKNEFLIIWTTTPWTIPFNLAVMVHPDLEYLKVEVDENGEKQKWILAKALAGIVTGSVANKKMKVLEEFKGSKLESLQYVHPFTKYVKQFAQLKEKHPKVHTVILSEKYVDTSAGSGLVHAAPGCGPEDQEACQPYDIPPFNALTEEGFFPPEMGKFAGLRAKVDDQKFIDVLEDEKVLIAITEVEHEYPHCWRCKNPVVFRITYQWFFKIEDIKDKILKGNKKVKWVPDTALHAYESWVKNLKDNSITRQRFWGTPVPIWKCPKCASVTVIGSRKDIKDNGGKVPDDLHKPWIDAVKLDCSCGGKMQRVEDIIDVWVDAGTASWNCLNNDPQKMKELFPADMILEAREQTRLWFSMLSICSYLYLGENAFKNVYVYGMLNDIEGKKMSKSLGNIISPYELIDKHGVDVLRYYMCQNNAGEDINFSWEECKVKERQLQILWNLHKLLINLCKENDVNPRLLDEEKIKSNLESEEKYILSKLNSTTHKVTHLLDSYQIDQSIAPLEELYLELSRTYIQMVRDKSSIGEKDEKEAVIYTIYKVLLEFLKMFNVISPFISETIYQNFREEFSMKEESISHFGWPKKDSSFVDEKLEKSFDEIKLIIGAALAAREKAKIGLRWPIKEVVIASEKDNVKEAAEEYREIIKKQVNAKNIVILEKLPGIKNKVKPDFGKIGLVYGKLSPSIIAKLSSDSPETILNHLKKSGEYAFTIENNPVKINWDMVIVEKEIPPDYEEAELRNGAVYVNKKRDDELEAEGFAREIMRNVQSLRKEAGMEKTEKIILYIKASEKMEDQLESWQEDISEKVGAEKIKVSKVDPVKKFPNISEIKVKDEKFTVYWEKV